MAWYTSLDSCCGKAEIFFDGRLVNEVDLGLSMVGKDTRTYRKHYRHLVFSMQNLPVKEHTLRISVKGEPAVDSTNSYVNIDAFLILDGNEIGDTRFIINNEYNYPLISWANYAKEPIRIYSGYTRKVYTKLCGLAAI